MERSCELYLSALKWVHVNLVQSAKRHSTGSPFQKMKTHSLLMNNNNNNGYF